jgi:hypothetical protein
LPALECLVKGKTLYGQIAYVDRFGNLISNISQPRLQEFSRDQPVTVILGEHLIGGLSKTYADVLPGAPIALIGSFGFLEIGLNRGNAQLRYHARRGTPVIIEIGQTI